MTMPTDVAKPPRVEYVEDGVTLVHSTQFKFIATGDVHVVRILPDGTELELAQPADYSVQGGGYDVGQITKTSGGTIGATIRIDRKTERKQDLDILQGVFDEESHERALDRLTMIVQELERDAITAAGVRNIVADQLEGGAGISLEAAAGNETITIVNNYDHDWLLLELSNILFAGSGIAIIPAGDQITITADEPTVGSLADMLMLSGDQQGGGTAGTGDGSFAEVVLDLVAAALEGVGLTVAYDDVTGTITLTNDVSAEFIRDTIGAALVGASGLTVTVNDAGDTITLTPPAGGGTDLEAVRDMLAGCLQAGTSIAIVPNDAGDTIVISSSALDPSYKGLVPIAKAAAFDIADSMNGRAVNFAGAAAIATIELDADVPLSSGFATVIRNNNAAGGGNLQIKRIGAGVTLKKNGGTVSADAVLPPGGVATLQRWAADDFTISGNVT